MATITSTLTNSGVESAILAQAEEGFFVRVSAFGVSETAGVLDATRTTPNTQWYKALISSSVKVDQNTVQINCSIPPNAEDFQTGLKVSGTKTVGEIYIYAKDREDNEFLFAIGQPEFTEIYSTAAALTLRLSIRLVNSSVDDVYQFLYTQAAEVGDHNNDMNAHPHLQDMFEHFGMHDQESTRVWNGQLIDNFPNNGSVSDKDAVYYDDSDGLFKSAIFDGTEKEIAVGVYSAAKQTIIYSGIIDFNHNYEAYTNLYLSPSTLGKYSDAPTDILIGYALPDNKVFVSPLDTRLRVGANGGGNASFEVNQLGHNFKILDAIYFDGGHVDPLQRVWKLAKADDEYTLATHVVTGFNETLPNIFTATKFGRDAYVEKLMKSQGEYYYLSPYYGVDLEVLSTIAAGAITVQGYPAIFITGASLEDRAQSLASGLNGLNSDFRATALGAIVHFETPTSLGISTTDPTVIKRSNISTRAGYGTPVIPTEGYDNPLYYIETRNVMHSTMHRPTGLGGAGKTPSGIGKIERWPAGSEPNGLFACDGSVYERSSYARLFDVIGTSYNTGGESASEFRVPSIPNESLSQGSVGYYIRYSLEAILESDLAVLRKNPVRPTGSEGATAGVSYVDSEKYSFYKMNITSNKNISITKMLAGRKVSIAIASQAGGSVNVALTPETSLTGITDIQVVGNPSEGGISNPVSGVSTYTISIPSNEEKKVEIECHSFGTVLYVYFKTTSGWSV